MKVEQYNCPHCWKLYVVIDDGFLKQGTVLALVGVLDSPQLRDDCIDCLIRLHLVEGRRARLDSKEFTYSVKGFTKEYEDLRQTGIGADGSVILVQRDSWLVLEDNPDFGLPEKEWLKLTAEEPGSLVFLDEPKRT